jgi:hypothetical protein
VRVEFLAKLYFLRRHRPEELEPLIGRQEEALKQALDKLEPRAATGGDAWMTSVAASYRRWQTQSALGWLAEVRELVTTEREDTP